MVHYSNACFAAHDETRSGLRGLAFDRDVEDTLITIQLDCAAQGWKLLRSPHLLQQGAPACSLLMPSWWHLLPMQRRSGLAASYSGGPEGVKLGFAAAALADLHCLRGESCKGEEPPTSQHLTRCGFSVCTAEHSATL